MTKQEAIENHRKMWNWIADRTEKEQRRVSKWEYFKAMGIEDIPRYFCYCCEYTVNEGVVNCDKCPIDWGSKSDELMCFDRDKELDNRNLYARWFRTSDWQEAAELAREIAQLPERSEEE